MRLLLDTQVWIWMRSAPKRLSAKVRRHLEDERNVLLLSAAVPWEIALEVRLGKLRLPCAVEDYVTTRSAETRVTPLPITQLHAMESAALPLHHLDPFDRILIAQARLESVAVLSADSAFAAYDVKLLRAR
jgi:PIN domain nuclease of toxin-antitoxin system